MLPFSGGRLHVGAVAASRLHLSQWVDRCSLRRSLSPLSGTDSRSSIKVEGFFFSVRQPLVWLKSPGRTSSSVSLPFCQPSAVLSSGASEESVQTTEGSQGSVRRASQFTSVFLGWFPTACTLVFVVQLCFGPAGPPASPALPQSELGLPLPDFKIHFIYCIFGT